MIWNWILDFLSYGILIFFFWANLVYCILALRAGFVIFTQQEEIEAADPFLLHDEETPGISLIIPSYNESATALFAVHTLLNIPYQNKELLFVDDGSSDDTLELMKQEFKLFLVHIPKSDKVPTGGGVEKCYKSLTHSNLTVIRKENTLHVKADAINAGINIASHDLVLVMDADTLIDSEEFDRLLRYIMLHPEIEAFGATIRVANDSTVRLRGITEVHLPKNFLAAVQVVEYLRAFLIGRLGWDFLGGALILSGAFTVFRTETIKELGGYDTQSIGEDLEITIRYKRVRLEKKESAYTGFLPQPVCWTEVPENLHTLGEQRVRWQKGLASSLWKHRKLFFHPKYGVVGLMVFPFFVFYELLSPLFEVAGYIFIFSLMLIGHYFNPFVPLFLGISLGVTMCVNIYTVTLDRYAFHKYKKWSEYFSLLLFSVLEPLGYRQINVWWRLKALFYMIVGKRGWEVVKKRGFFAKQKPPSPQKK